MNLEHFAYWPPPHECYIITCIHLGLVQLIYKRHTLSFEVHKRFSIESPWIRSNNFFFFFFSAQRSYLSILPFPHTYINNHPTTSAKLPLIVASYELPTVSKETTSSLDHFLSLLQPPLSFLSFFQASTP